MIPEPDNIDWSAVFSPITFEPVYALTVRGFNTNIQVSRERIQDGKFNYNDFMLELLEKENQISIGDAAVAIRKLQIYMNQHHITK